MLSAEMLSKFEPHANDACTFDGKLLCLRHDTAPMVLYFNKPLMDKFGYRVLVTWQEYQALGERVGREHPGYILGAFGDARGFKAYFDASGCPSSWVLDEKHVHINFGDARCVRAAKVVDILLENKTLAPYSYFDPRFDQIVRTNQLRNIRFSNISGVPGYFVESVAFSECILRSPVAAARRMRSGRFPNRVTGNPNITCLAYYQPMDFISGILRA